ncbi:Heme exporter protein D [Vibrio tubiashii]|uniref:Uncharacterized protein n=1 Tax=Vibrio tubiashii ATCC 19109 TaxID=1051646 RepID=F9TCE7_9VIBR|nr:hypothetical protein [Vibrio tubiashii]AIW13947.1 hypothetical protein IX91_06995 [Vibrio tubiashii ATCC 19109]EGU47834.1 hypothetical protein VITU9109_12003 [Vibrio tubiashii ATCC 19109]EIF03030.1 hypothetical protein VT1337_15574 [Vibrio tubiashii NCIMB 1337 = ATCC 19106]
MEFEIYMPCEPIWICESFLILFALLSVLGIAAFIYILYKEYLKIQRASRVISRRKKHHSKR